MPLEAKTPRGCDSIGAPAWLLHNGPCSSVCGVDGRGEVVRREGYLIGHSRSRVLLCSGGVPTSDGCTRLDLRYVIGADLTTYQWNGDRVEVTGVPSGEDSLGLVVREMRLLEREASPAFCGYVDGPLEPAPLEDAYDHAWVPGAPRSRLAAGGEVRLHVYKAVAGYFPPGWSEPEPAETVAFEVPEPFAGRDIESFLAFSKRNFVFQLRDGSLYRWQEGELQPLPEGGGDVRELELGGDGNVYFHLAYWRERSPGGGLWSHPRVVWNGVRRLTPSGELTTVWSSTSLGVASLEWMDGEGLFLELEELRYEDGVLICPDGRQVEAGFVESSCWDAEVPGGGEERGAPGER